MRESYNESTSVGKFKCVVGYCIAISKVIVWQLACVDFGNELNRMGNGA